MSSSSNLKKTLLASTCLTALTIGSAQAVVVNEATDFANNLLGATVLPSDTTQVNGTIEASTGTDSRDYFAVTGLTPGALVSVSYTANLSDFFAYTNFDTDAGINIGSGATLTVGSLGLVAFGTDINCGDVCEDVPYTVNISVRNSQTPVPLAPTAALIGVGAAAMGLRRRKPSAK
jgi:hypothetical protein